MPMLVLMNAIAQASAAPVSGSKLDNRRVIAAIVDLLIVTAGALVILVAGDSLSGDRPGALAAVVLGWALYYFFALESGEGQTLGKRLMKIRVVRADGRPASMGEIAVRTILRVIDNYLVGLIVMLATGERRQRIGDLAAGTIVVDAAGPAVMAPPAPAAEPFQPVDHEDELYVEDEDEAEVDYEAEADYEEPEAEVEDDPVATQTITLPARPAPPETLADLTEPEAEAVAEELVVSEVAGVPATEDSYPEEPVVSEVAGVPATEDSYPEEEPVVATGVVPAGPVDAEEELPAVMSPALEELSEDVAAAHVEPEVEEAEDAVEEDVQESDEPVNVKSVETVSAMDLIMGAADESAAEQDDSGSDQDAEGPDSA
jgi:uncharacterized RDD family membrane protein YckC